jgi:hypothetical protein
MEHAITARAMRRFLRYPVDYDVGDTGIKLGMTPQKKTAFFQNEFRGMFKKLGILCIPPDGRYFLGVGMKSKPIPLFPPLDSGGFLFEKPS